MQEKFHLNQRVAFKRGMNLMQFGPDIGYTEHQGYIVNISTSLLGKKYDIYDIYSQKIVTGILEKFVAVDKANIVDKLMKRYGTKV